MNITIAQGAFFPVPPLMGGAVEKVWYALGKEFSRRGHQVTHVSRLHSNLPKETVEDGVRHIRIEGYDAPKSLFRLKVLDLLYTLRMLRVLPRSDILVTNTFWLPIVGSRAKYGALYVHVARYPKGQMRLYRKAARLQAVSNVVAEAIKKEARTLVQNVTVIPNPLPPNAYTLKKSEAKARRNWILYVGRIHPEKGLSLLIDAFKQLCAAGKNLWRLVVVGPWEEKHGGAGATYLKTLQDEAKSIADRVDWVGPIFDEEKLRTFYGEARIFVYPSLADRGEACPLAPLEAMASGCVPVVSDLKCFKDYLRPNENGLVFSCHTAEAPDLLANQLKQLMDHPDVLQVLSDNAFDTAKNFTVSEIAGRYLADFEKLLK